ncbi:MAG TPA: ammonium transporter [Marmoricola sp.]|nr:ammonium transporter [Marmoricola sp.]
MDGNAAWMLTSASLVLLMTPGLAFFYGGMTRPKSVLNMMMMSFGAMGVVGILYVLYGFSMSFGTRELAGVLSDPFQWWGLNGVTGPDGSRLVNGDPAFGYIGVAFQLTFAIITVALVSGAIADRARFGTWLVFSAVWVTLVYFPLAHMVWGGGFLSGADVDGLAARVYGVADGAARVVPQDFAGGTVVHVNAGVAGLVLALVIGRRKGFGREPMRPHNLPLVMLGAGLLWFGWFGFNAGSELAADGTAGLVWVNTCVATCAAMLGWLLLERIRDGKGTSLGAASGAVAGLVAITPSCAALTPSGSILLGLVTGMLCAMAVGLKYRFGFDDSLDVVGVHLVGGFVGTVSVGFLDSSTGLFYGHGPEQLVVQLLVVLVALAFSGVLSLAIGLALKATLGWRIDEDAEVEGIDVSQHGETAYDFGWRGLAGGVVPAAVPGLSPAPALTTEGANR